MKAWSLLLASLTLSGCTLPLVRSSSGRAPSRVPSLPRRFVPSGGRVEHVWNVPAGKGVPEVVVGWSSRRGGCRLFKATPTGRCYALTVWSKNPPARGTPTTLFRRSPFPFQPTSVRLADLTGDGHRDLLVTIECNVCNHAASSAAVYADLGGKMRRIYGSGFWDWSNGHGIGVPGRQITETAWGARRGLLWFDAPKYGPQDSVCCPAYRVQTFLRWDRGHWRTVRKRKVSPDHSYLDRRPVPAP